MERTVDIQGVKICFQIKNAGGIYIYSIQGDELCSLYKIQMLLLYQILEMSENNSVNSKNETYSSLNCCISIRLYWIEW